MALLLIFGPVRDLNASVAALYCTYRWCYATTALSHLGTFGEDSALSVLDRKELNGRFPFSCFLRMSSRLKKIIKRCEPAINLTATYKNKTKQKSGSVEVDITGSSSSRTTAEEARSGRTELSLQIQYSNSSFFPQKTNQFRLHWTLARCSQGQGRDTFLQSVHIIDFLINNAEVRKFVSNFFSREHTEIICNNRRLGKKKKKKKANKPFSCLFTEAAATRGDDSRILHYGDRIH